jgi:hypothetical protein
MLTPSGHYFSERGRKASSKAGRMLKRLLKKDADRHLFRIERKSDGGDYLWPVCKGVGK